MNSSPVVTRLIDAHGIVLGKTNMEELAEGMTTINPVYGPVLNPYNNLHDVGGKAAWLGCSGVGGLGGAGGGEGRGVVRGALCLQSQIQLAWSGVTTHHALSSRSLCVCCSSGCPRGNKLRIIRFWAVLNLVCIGVNPVKRVLTVPHSTFVIAHPRALSTSSSH